jgi:hypothetical protein
MYRTISIVAIACAVYSMPAFASKTAELKAACEANPQHQVCQEREAKAAKAKARREAKMDAAIQRVKENK